MINSRLAMAVISGLAMLLLAGPDAQAQQDNQWIPQASGYYWGEPSLRIHVERILTAARAENDDRLVQLAERWLR